MEAEISNPGRAAAGAMELHRHHGTGSCDVAGGDARSLALHRHALRADGEGLRHTERTRHSSRMPGSVGNIASFGHCASSISASCSAMARA